MTPREFCVQVKQMSNNYNKYAVDTCGRYSDLILFSLHNIDDVDMSEKKEYKQPIAYSMIKNCDCEWLQMAGSTYADKRVRDLRSEVFCKKCGVKKDDT